MLAHLSVVVIGNFSWFRIVTVPMDGVQGN